MFKTYGDVGSKFKFVLLASKRAKQLLKGAKPKLKSKSKSLIRVAQQEVREGLLDYEIIQRKKEEEYRPEEDFIGEEIEEEKKVTEEKEKKKPAKEKEEKPKKSKEKKKSKERKK